MNRFVIWFTKITAIPVEFIYFRRKNYYVNKKKQDRKIKGNAIVVSNHTSIYDFALYLFLFFNRNVHFLIADIIYKRSKILAWFLKSLGGIKVEREALNFDFVGKSLEILEQGGVVGVFPEARLPLKGEPRPLPFKISAVYIAVKSGAPIIPVYTDGNYGRFKRRAHVIIGEKINLLELWDNQKTEEDNLNYLNNYLRDSMIALGERLDDIKKQKKKKN